MILILTTGIFVCWVLALVPAVPMWIPHGTHRTPENDGTHGYCSFPYESVSKWTGTEQLKQSYNYNLFLSLFLFFSYKIIK